MRREGFSGRVGEQEEEADPQEESHPPAVFAAPDGPVSGGELRDIRYQFPSGFGHLFG
jgi:uncharacterized protein (DUF2267 family)